MTPAERQSTISDAYESITKAVGSLAKLKGECPTLSKELEAYESMAYGLAQRIHRLQTKIKK